MARILRSLTKSQHEMERRLLLNVVVGQRSFIIQLLAGINEPLLVGRNAFLVLDFGFQCADGVAGLYFQRDGFSGERLYENLHWYVICDTTIYSSLNVFFYKSFHFFGIDGAPQKAVFVAFQSVDAAQGAFNAAGQLVNAAALARRASWYRNALFFRSDLLHANPWT